MTGLLKKGSIIIHSKPFSYTIAQQEVNARCHHCLIERSILMTCKQCNFAKYCNKSCQKGSWKFHKKECIALKKISPRIPPDSVRLMALIIWKLQSVDGDEAQMVGDQKRSFKDLKSHSADIQKDSRRYEHFLTVQQCLNEYMGSVKVPPSQQLLDVFGRMVVNCYNITDSEMQMIGTGLYLGASILDHSCQPNATVAFQGTQLIIRTTQDLECVDISKVHINYIDVMDSTITRRRSLLTQYYFLCECPACLDTERNKMMEGLRCSVPDCEVPVDLHTGYCDKCGIQCHDPTAARQIITGIESTLRGCKNLKKIGKWQTVNYECKRLLETVNKTFHPMNVWRVKILDTLSDSCIDLEWMEEAIKYMRLMVTPYRFYYGQFHPSLGILLSKLGKTELELGRFSEAESHLRESLTILGVTHGVDHEFCGIIRDLHGRADSNRSARV